MERIDYSPITNAAIGVGTKRDPHAYTYLNLPINYNQQMLDAYYRSSWACRRVCEIMPRFMTRKWGTHTLGGEQKNNKTIPYLLKRHKELRVKSSFKEAQILANIHGSAYILIIADDDESWETMPIESKIKELIVVDRWVLFPEEYTILQKPEYYTLRNASLIVSPDIQNKIHKSRVLKFSGNYLPYHEKRRNFNSEASLLEAFIEVWKRFFVSHASLSKVIVDFDIFCHEIDGLFDMLLQGGKKAEEQIRERMEANDITRSVYKSYLIDKTKEKGHFLSRNLSGVSDIVGELKSELVAASGYPKSVLFGEFAAGLDSSGRITGEQHYLNDLVEEAQGDKFDDNLDTLNNYLLSESESPKENIELGWMWKPLYTETERGKAEIRKLYAETDEINISTGVYSEEEARGRYFSPEASGEIVLRSDGRNDARLDAARLANLEKVGGRVRYKGKLYTPNRVSYGAGRLSVLATKNGYVKLVRFTEKDVTDETITDTHDPRYWANLFMSFREPQKEKEDDSTPAQKIIKWQGYEIGLQYFPFQERHGKILPAGYGHFRKTKGADGMAVDAYIGTQIELDKIFVIEQLVNDEFDEEKFVIGVNSVEEAKALYLKCMPEEMLGKIKEVSLEYLDKYYV